MVGPRRSAGAGHSITRTFLDLSLLRKGNLYASWGERSPALACGVEYCIHKLGRNR